MAQTVLSVRLDAEDKKCFDAFCAATGMNASVAVNMFVKAVLREQKLPFEVKADPFYSDANQLRLKRAVSDLNAGKGTEHELIEVDND